MVKKLFFTLILVLIIAPSLALAVRAPGIPYWPSNDHPLISCTGDLNPSTSPIKRNPCVSLCDLIDTIVNIIYFAMTLALEVFAPILFLWGGFMVLTAGAKPDQISTGKKIMTGTIVGIILVLFAFLIVRTVASVIGVNIPGFTSALNCSVPPPPPTPTGQFSSGACSPPCAVNQVCLQQSGTSVCVNQPQSSLTCDPSRSYPQNGCPSDKPSCSLNLKTNVASCS